MYHCGSNKSDLFEPEILIYFPKKIFSLLSDKKILKSLGIGPLMNSIVLIEGSPLTWLYLVWLITFNRILPGYRKIH